jgi:hypothetical protein
MDRWTVFGNTLRYGYGEHDFYTFPGDAERARAIMDAHNRALTHLQVELDAARAVIATIYREADDVSLALAEQLVIYEAVAPKDRPLAPSRQAVRKEGTEGTDAE